MRGGVVGIQPAQAVRAGLHVQPRHLGHAQAAAVEQLGDGVVARGECGRRVFGAVFGQRHGLVHGQRLGQRLGRLRRAHPLHRVHPQHAVAPPPAVETAPCREVDGDAARRQPAHAQLRRPAADVVHLRLRQLDAHGRGAGLQAQQGFAVHRQRARGQPALDAQVLQKGLDARLEVHGPAQARRRRRVSAADDTSPMRIRNSVPMSAA